MVRASFAPAVSRQTIGSSAAEPHLLCEPTLITRRGGWEACDARRTKGVVGCEPRDGPARRIYVKHYQVARFIARCSNNRSVKRASCARRGSASLTCISAHPSAPLRNQKFADSPVEVSRRIEPAAGSLEFREIGPYSFPKRHRFPTSSSPVRSRGGLVERIVWVTTPSHSRPRTEEPKATKQS